MCLVASCVVTDNTLVSINVVALSRAQLLLGWVTANM